MNDGKHPCPVKGCSVGGLDYGTLMCLMHWRMVPKDLKIAVYAAWNGRDDMSNYLTIRQAAIDSVEEREAARR